MDFFDLFDMGEADSGSTSSGLYLTFDAAIDTLETWSSLSLGITFWSQDTEGESAKISVFSTGWEQLSSVDFNAGYWRRRKYRGESYDYSEIFSDDLIANLQSRDTIKIRIKAPNQSGYNDFTITSVSLTVETQPTPSPVPEPATILLLGAGLAGLAGVKKAARRPGSRLHF